MNLVYKIRDILRNVNMFLIIFKAIQHVKSWLTCACRTYIAIDDRFVANALEYIFDHGANT